MKERNGLGSDPDEKRATQGRRKTFMESVSRAKILPTGTAIGLNNPIRLTRGGIGDPASAE